MDCIRGLIVVYLYSISNGRACCANDDHERNCKRIEVGVLKKANCLRVLWAMVDVLSTNHSSLFIKKQMRWRVLAAWFQWLYVFESEENSISCHIVYNSNFWLISTGLASDQGKVKFYPIYFKYYPSFKKFKWSCSSKRTLMQDGEGRRKKWYLIIDNCHWTWAGL